MFSLVSKYIKRFFFLISKIRTQTHLLTQGINIQMQIPWSLLAVSKKFLVSLNNTEQFNVMCTGPMENIIRFWLRYTNNPSPTPLHNKKHGYNNLLVTSTRKIQKKNSHYSLIPWIIIVFSPTFQKQCTAHKYTMRTAHNGNCIFMLPQNCGHHSHITKFNRNLKK